MYEMRKRKGGDEGKQTLDTMIYHVVLVGTKPLLVHVVKTLTQEYCFPVTKSILGHSLICHKGSTTKAHVKFPNHLDAVSTKKLFHEGRGSPYPPHMVIDAAPHQAGGSKVCWRATKAPRRRHTLYNCGSLLEPITR